MEMYVTIIEQREVQSRQYTNQQGQNAVFHSRGFVLSNGIDEFYAEMTGDNALSCLTYDRSVMHRMQGSIRQRRFLDRNGIERFENLIFITKLV